MFGGLAFMIAGNMACGIVGTDLMLRLGEDGADAALDEPHVRPMGFTHRRIRTMVYVGATGVETDQALQGWVDKAVAYATTLPSKEPPAFRSCPRHAPPVTERPPSRDPVSRDLAAPPSRASATQGGSYTDLGDAFPALAMPAGRLPGPA